MTTKTTVHQRYASEHLVSVIFLLVLMIIFFITVINVGVLFLVEPNNINISLEHMLNLSATQLHQFSTGLPGGHRHSHFPQIRQFLKAAKVAVKRIKAKWL
jgi:hypothetical protein